MGPRPHVEGDVHHGTSTRQDRLVADRAPVVEEADRAAGLRAGADAERALRDDWDLLDPSGEAGAPRHDGGSALRIDD